MRGVSGSDVKTCNENVDATNSSSPSGTVDDMDTAAKPKPSHVSSFPGHSFWGGIRGKLISIFVLIKVVPLILLCWLAWHEINDLGQRIDQRTVVTVDETRGLVKNVGKKASEDSIRALDVKSREAIERLTTDTARQVADFLHQCDQQVLLASELPPDEKRYRQFLQTLTRKSLDHGTWVLRGDEWVPAEPPSPQPKNVMTAVEDNRKDWHYRPPERQGRPVSTPLYAEMTFVGLDGVEKI